MLRREKILLAPTLSKATRLQLGNIKTKYGYVSTAAGSTEKWGFIFSARHYPLISLWWAMISGSLFIAVAGTYQQYRDMVILTENITYEDIKDRCLTPMPGWARLRTLGIANPCGPMTYRDPTPLDWLPFDLKLGYVKQASY